MAKNSARLQFIIMYFLYAGSYCILITASMRICKCSDVIPLSVKICEMLAQEFCNCSDAKQTAAEK